MSFDENQVLMRINKLHKVQRAYAGLIDAKYVNIRGNKVCAYCLKVIHSGERALTSSVPVDKKYDTKFRYAYDNNCVKRYKLVLVRQWMHKDCASSASYLASNVELKDKWYKRIDFDEIDMSKVSDGEALEIIRYFHSIGEISNSEYDELENSIINSIAFRDAMGIGQE